jgi:hypothetical protein
MKILITSELLKVVWGEKKWMHTLFHEPWTPPPLNLFPPYPNNLESSSTPNSMTAISNRKNQTKSKSPKSGETNGIQQTKPHFHVWVALHSPPGADCNGCGRGTFAARARQPAATTGCDRASLRDGGRRALRGMSGILPGYSCKEGRRRTPTRIPL